MDLREKMPCKTATLQTLHTTLFHLSDILETVQSEVGTGQCCQELEMG